jgi:hypothetical protein
VRSHSEEKEGCHEEEGGQEEREEVTPFFARILDEG